MTCLLTHPPMLNHCLDAKNSGTKNSTVCSVDETTDFCYKDQKHHESESVTLWYENNEYHVPYTCRTVTKLLCFSILTKLQDPQLSEVTVVTTSVCAKTDPYSCVLHRAPENCQAIKITELRKSTEKTQLWLSC